MPPIAVIILYEEKRNGDVCNHNDDQQVQGKYLQKKLQKILNLEYVDTDKCIDNLYQS